MVVKPVLGAASLAASVLLAASPAGAQTTTPSAEFQYSAITGTNSVINVSRVPVTKSNGQIVYYDMALTFDVSAGGVPTLATSAITLSQNLRVSTFKTGTYVASADTNFSVLVTGPGIAEAGTTAWTLSSTGEVCGLPSTGNWYAGSISSNPYASRITAAGITSTDFSYGIVGTPNANCYPFASGNLIGASQVGNTLTIADFSAGNGTDGSIPLSVTTFVLSQ